jgi:hypothetical protein
MANYLDSLLNRKTNTDSDLSGITPMGTGLSDVKPMTEYNKNTTSSSTSSTSSTPFLSSILGDKVKSYAVYTSKPAENATQNNVTDLNNYNTGGNNVSGQNILNNVNNSLSTSQTAGLSAVIQELTKRYNESQSQLDAALNSANQAQSSGDMKTLNDYMTEANRLNEERTKTLNDLYAQITPLQTQLLGTLTPSQGETDIQNQLLAKQQQLGQFDIETQKGVYGLEGQGRGITAGLVSGQQAKLQQQRALDRTSIAQEESNLLTRLGLAQDARTAQTKTLETGLSQLSSNIELQQKAIEAINTQNTNVLNAANTLSDNARSTLTNILDKFAGLDFNTLDTASQQSLKNLAQSAGIDIGIVSAGMKAVKDQQDYENALNTYKAQDTAKNAAGLTPAQINSTVNSIASAFDNEPTVKSYNVAQEGYQTLKSIGTDTKSPADDIAYIYGFAKIMDPNSVVREGEYNTVQKYAQTWADNFGFTAKRIFSNTNFLSKDAKQKMLNALEAKMGSMTKQYQNVYSEYQRQIQDAYSGSARNITDYSKAFGTESTSLKDQVNAKGYDYDAMRKDYSDEEIRSSLGL